MDGSSATKKLLKVWLRNVSKTVCLKVVSLCKNRFIIVGTEGVKENAATELCKLHSRVHKSLGIKIHKRELKTDLFNLRVHIELLGVDTEYIM